MKKAAEASNGLGSLGLGGCADSVIVDVQHAGSYEFQVGDVQETIASATPRPELAWLALAAFMVQVRGLTLAQLEAERDLHEAYQAVRVLDHAGAPTGFRVAAGLEKQRVPVPPRGARVRRNVPLDMGVEGVVQDVYPSPLECGGWVLTVQADDGKEYKWHHECVDVLP